jgi:hypothetical protein
MKKLGSTRCQDVFFKLMPSFQELPERVARDYNAAPGELSEKRVQRQIGLLSEPPEEPVTRAL